MASLNLVGNGFDLYHGFPSAYYYFACFLIDNHPEFYDELGKMYGFTVKEEDRTFGKIKCVVENDLFWSDFENRLGNLDSTWLEESLQDDLGLEYPDDPININIPETTNSEVIKRYFAEWIRTTVGDSLCMDIIKNKIESEKLKLKKRLILTYKADSA